MTVETIEKIKTTDGTLFDDSYKAKKYDDSYLRVKLVIDGLGKEPENSYPNKTCVQVEQEALDNAIRIFKEECELWLPEPTAQFNKVQRNFHFHDGIISRYLSDGNLIPSNLYNLCFILCSIDTDELLRYDQIWSKNHPAGIKVEGE